MKTCRNHLDLSLAKVGVLSQSSQFIASKSRGFVAIISIYRQQKSRFCAIISIYRQQKSRFCAIISIYRQQKSQKCLAFCEIRAKNLIFRFRAKILIFSSLFRFRAKILIFSSRANLNIRFIASKSRGQKIKKQERIYRQQNSYNHLDLPVAKLTSDIKKEMTATVKFDPNGTGEKSGARPQIFLYSCFGIVV